MAGKIQLKFGMGMPYPEGVSAAKMVNFHSGIIELQMCEFGIVLVPIKYKPVCCGFTLTVLGRTTLSYVLI